MALQRKKPDDAHLGLRVDRETAERRLRKHIEDGQRIATAPDDESWNSRRNRWLNVTEIALESIFTTGKPGSEFKGKADRRVMVSGLNGPQLRQYQRGGVRSGVTLLESYLDALDYLVPPSRTAAESAASTNVPQADRTVFIVHGHDDTLKTEVARVLEKTGEHDVVILHEQPNKGRTLMEKLEQHAARSGFAVILLTADDAGRAKSAIAERPRARQNVVFEFGYFAGVLTRTKVAVLYEEGVELPSDLQGLVYIETDARGAWRYDLLKELRSAGFDYDAHKL